MENHLGRLVALVHETVKTEQFETWVDLVEAVKQRAARLKLRYDSRLIGDAIERVERVRGKKFLPPLRALQERLEPGAPAISRGDAARLLAEIRRRTGQTPIKTMPAAKPLKRRKDDRVRALRQVAALIKDTAEHVAALEAEVEQGKTGDPE